MELSIKCFLLLKMTAVLIFTVANSAAQTENLQPKFYGQKCYTNQTFQEREDLANVVFTGRIKAIHRNSFNSSYSCTIYIYRVMKGEDTMSLLLNLNSVPTAETFYKHTIDVSGFGSDTFCDSKVVHGDTRIFLTTFDFYTGLSLSSSVARIGVRSLQRTEIIYPAADNTEKEADRMLTECKYFFCSFYAVCKLGRLTGDPYCECPNCENELPEQVCGSDGNWYKNSCEVRKAACLRRKRIKSRHLNWCEARRGVSTTTTLKLITTSISDSVEQELTSPETMVPANRTTISSTPTTTSTTPTSTTTTTTATTAETTDIASTTNDSTTKSAKLNPCDAESCKFGAECKVSMDGLSARCECPYSCENYGDSMSNMLVCGTDGKDYANQCELRKVSCASMSTTTVEKLGRCEPCKNVNCPLGQTCVIGEFNTAVCECSKECQGLDSQLPVCGTDGRNYNNLCLLYHASCMQADTELAINVAYLGRCKSVNNPCASISCENYATCRVSDEGTPTCICPDNCPLERSPVCGSNNEDYKNLCKLQQDACVNQVKISAVANQHCSENPCLNHKCPHDGQCELSLSATDRIIPTCTCPACTAVLKPVCGADGITYSNLCSLKQSNCLNKRDVQISNAGECGLCVGTYCDYGVCHNKNGTAVCLCPVDACVGSHSPLCADDGITYPNMCELTLEACRHQRPIKKVTDGPCDGNQCTRTETCKYKGVCVGLACLCNFECDDREEYICGSDGKTHQNKCSLDKKSCNQQVLFTVRHEGQCDDKMGGSVDGGNYNNETVDGRTAGRTANQSRTTTESAICNMDTNCRFDGRCDYTDGEPGICRCDGFFEFCEAEDQATCGSDGVAYKNICELRETQCRTQKEIGPKFKEYCITGVPTNTTTPNIPITNTSVEAGPLCYNSQPALTDDHGKVVNCSSCLPDRVAQCDVCLTDISYCNHRTAACCPKDPSLPECTYTRFGCCPDNITLPSPGPENRGCPYTCECHEFGSNGQLCDAVRFQCDCKPGVVGKTCDQCKLGWWGLRKIQTMKNEGCLPCQCNLLGSVRSDCEQDTGRCICKNNGVTGLKCNKCAEGGMILTSNGCVKNSEGLTDITGQEMCDTKDCGNGKCIMVDEKTPSCTCEYDCPEKEEYVCGSDQQTYKNYCHLRRKACVDGDLMKLKDSRCDNLMFSSTLLDFNSTTEYVPETTTPPSGIGLLDWWNSKKRYLADEASRIVMSEVDIGDPPGMLTCKDNPCDNSGTCLTDEKLGFVCICNVYWQGAKCQQANVFSSPQFSGDSFIEYIWDKASTSFDLHLTLIPTSDTGVVLFSGKSSGKSDFMSLVLKDGYVEYRFDTGGGSVLLRSEERLITNKQYSIRAQRTGRVGHLIVNEQVGVTKQAPGKHINLDVEPILYVGQATNQYREKLPKRLLRNLGGVQEGFKGCLRMLHDADANTDKEFLLTNEREANIVAGRDIGQCESDPCLQAPCLHQGVCIMIDAYNYQCECSGLYEGANCGSRSKSVRDLMAGSRDSSGGIKSSSIITGTGNTGKEDSVAFELPRFAGNSYIQYRLASEIDYSLKVDIIFSTVQDDGVLVFGSQVSDSAIAGDFILISFEERVPILRFDLGSGLNTLRSEHKITLKKWNQISVKRTGRQASLSVNGTPAKNMVAKGKMSFLNIKEEITLGAIPHHIEHSRDYLHSPGLHGVIQKVTINGDDMLDFFDSTHLLYRVKKYNGLPCRPNPCSKGTKCVPLLDMYRCVDLF